MAEPEHWFEPIADHLGAAYLRYSFTKGTDQEVDFLVSCLGLTSGDRILDVGCGPGRHAHALGRRGFEVVGVDISEEQLRLARAEVPEATFVQADFAELDFYEASFDVVVAFYSIVHVPRAQHSALFADIRRWLKPGGLFLASLSRVGGPDRTEEWLGVEMFFSGFPAETNRQLVREAGFELLFDEVVWMREPGVDVAFLWVLGEKPS